MRNRNPESLPGFRPAGRRYHAPAFKGSPPSASFGPDRGNSRTGLAAALRELSAEDEELPCGEGAGPVVFKDGVFQIDVDNAGAADRVDPALKGLIDSILGG
jgi:hypothetical protein